MNNAHQILTAIIVAAIATIAAAYASPTISVNTEPVNIEIIKPLVITHPASDQGTLTQIDWFKVVRTSSNISSVKLRLEITNLDQLTEYYKYLIIQIRETYIKLSGPSSFSAVSSRSLSENQDQSGENAPEDIGGYHITRSTLVNKIASLIASNTNSAGINITASAENILNKVKHIYLTLINDTSNQTIVSDVVLDEIVADGFNFTVIPLYRYGSSWSARIIYDSMQDKYYWDSRENDSIIIAVNKDSDNWPEKATNYTLILKFTDASGKTLFTLKWSIRWYQEDNDDQYDKVDINEYMRSVYPVLELGDIRAVLGFNEASGLWKPTATLTIPNTSWRSDGGSSAIYGAVVAYESRGGLITDAVPILVKIAVVETS